MASQRSAQSDAGSAAPPASGHCSLRPRRRLRHRPLRLPSDGRLPRALGAWDGLRPDEQILLAAARLIDEQLSEVITLRRLCGQLQLDARSLTAAFKQFHGLTMSAYLLQFRARCLFALISHQPEVPLPKLLRRCGISGTPSERRAFRRQFARTIEDHQLSCSGPAPLEARRLQPAGPSAVIEAIARLRDRRSAA